MCLCGICKTHFTGADVKKIEGWMLMKPRQNDIHAQGVGALILARPGKRLII